jgi:hypothetical protein
VKFVSAACPRSLAYSSYSVTGQRVSVHCAVAKLTKFRLLTIAQTAEFNKLGLRVGVTPL